MWFPIRLKNFLRKTFSQLTSEIIPCLDLRKNLLEVNVIQGQISYTPNLGTIRSHGSDYYWSSFTALPVDPLFYKKIDRALIVGNGIVINPEGKVVLESTLFQREYLFKLGQNHLILSRFSKKRIHLKKLMLSLSNVLEDNYYHWVMESITRVLLIEGVVDLRDLVVVVNDHPASFKADSLHFLFGISGINLKSKKAKEVYQGTAVVPSFTHTRNVNTRMIDICHPDIIRRLNRRVYDRLHSDAGGRFPLRFILSRGMAHDRRILNDEYLLGELGDKTFRVIDTETLSFADQVRLFFNAQFVISTHGAGLTNIIFSKSITVVELFPQERNPRDAFVFSQISSVLQFSHHIISYSSYNATQDVMVDSKLVDSIKLIINNTVKVS